LLSGIAPVRVIFCTKMDAGADGRNRDRVFAISAQAAELPPSASAADSKLRAGFCMLSDNTQWSIPAVVCGGMLILGTNGKMRTMGRWRGMAYALASGCSVIGAICVAELTRTGVNALKRRMNRLYE